MKTFEEIPGLFYYDNIFSDLELKELEDIIDELEKLGEENKLLNNLFSYNKTRNRTQMNFGFYYSYGFDRDAKMISELNQKRIPLEAIKGVQPVHNEENLFKWALQVPVEPVPYWMNNLIQKLIDLNITNTFYDSSLINIYYKGGSIYPHIDHLASFERDIITIRLYSDTIMSFGYMGSHSLNDAKPMKNVNPIRVNLPRSSIIRMTDYSATNVSHGIFMEDLNSKSVSITLRKIKPQYQPNNYKGYENLNSLF